MIISLVVKDVKNTPSDSFGLAVWYNKHMDGQNNSWWDGGGQPQSIDTNPAQGKVTISQIGGTAATRPKSRTDLYIAGVLGGVILVAGIVFTALYMINRNNTTESSNEATVATNTDLQSGSVTTTIDGRAITYQAAYVVDGTEATISSGEYASTSDDEAVFLVINGGTLTIDGDITISKSGSADFQGRGDDYSFYGTNSAIVVVGEGSSATINGATITTDVSGANAVVATNGGTAKISNSKITTSQDNSRGLHATYQGVIEAESTEISTAGGSCAALATDRGEGTVTAKGMTLSTAGVGSPLIYSTGAITIANSTGTAEGAQIAVVEGKNSISLENCNFSANGIGNRGDVDNAGVMIYQSMSGDAGEGLGSFTAKASTLTILPDSSVYATAPFFLVTNTNADINLSDVVLSFSDASYLISAVGTSEWGQNGANGGTVTFTSLGLNATNTGMNIDEISSVTGV